MKKSFTMGLVIPLAVLFAFASAGLAADKPSQGKSDQKRTQARAGVSQTEPGTETASSPADTNRSGSRETGAQRGRLPRHGQTASSVVAEDQGKSKGDNNSGKSSSDGDEDEDGGTSSGN